MAGYCYYYFDYEIINMDFLENHSNRLCELAGQLIKNIMSQVDIKIRGFFVSNTVEINAASFTGKYLKALWENSHRDELRTIWAQVQLFPSFTHIEWAAYWKNHFIPNKKIKEKLGWQPKVSTRDGLEKFYSYCREFKKR